jgi:hypothetical protein
MWMLFFPSSYLENRLGLLIPEAHIIPKLVLDITALNFNTVWNITINSQYCLKRPPLSVSLVLTTVLTLFFSHGSQLSVWCHSHVISSFSFLSLPLLSHQMGKSRCVLCPAAPAPSDSSSVLYAHRWYGRTAVAHAHVAHIPNLDRGRAPRWLIGLWAQGRHSTSLWWCRP